jgi:hypothetical protein
LTLRFFLRQRRNRFAAALESGFVRLPIRETLARRIHNGARRTFPIVHAEGNAVAVAEVVFREIAMQMLFGTVLINAAHTAPENRKVALR